MALPAVPVSALPIPRPLEQSGIVYALPGRLANQISFTNDPFPKPSSTQFPLTTTVRSSVPATSGHNFQLLVTVLQTDGRPSVQPFPTPSISRRTNSSVSSHRSISTIAVTPFVSAKANITVPSLRRRAAKQAMIDQTEVFQAVATSSQGQGVWTHPYSLTWSKGTQSTQSWGMAISHIDADQRAFGPRNTAIPGSPAQYYINPIAIQSVILSAVELGNSTVLTTDSLRAFSANANLLPQAGSSSKITFPLVQGMGFVTGIYTSLQPAIQSSVFFRSVSTAAASGNGIFKYQITLEDGKSWLLFAIPANGQDPQLSLVSNTLLRGVPNWSGFIQVAKNPAGSSGESIYDNAAGVYPTGLALTASTFSQTGTYKFHWKKAGLARGDVPQLLMFALPHHVESFTGPTPFAKTSLRIQTTTKGIATAVFADSWTLLEANLPTDMGFAPWNGSLPQGSRSARTLSPAAVSVINMVAASEIRQDMDNQTNLDSMYFSGKALSKFATLIYTVQEMCDSRQTSRNSPWWQDFGNANYNDHHFHYGYFIHAAAIIAYLDPQWLQLNKGWVNMLVRDAANPSTSDPYFPFSRMFDWYHGHSWAKGLFESADAKDEESSSEDAFFAYAVKMWGRVTGDRSMEARGNLMLAVLARTLRNYFLLQDGNGNHPAEFVGNTVTGVVSAYACLLQMAMLAPP
ncbi:MAG: hypothetical protein Q9196_003031 [Gyalolechia fulgens]